MFWLAEDAFTRFVSLTWERQELPSPANGEDEQVGEFAEIEQAEEFAEAGTEASDVERYTVTGDGAQWRQIGSLHYVSYVDAAEAGEPGDRVTLKLEADKLTMVRHGSVRWNPTFQAGLTHHSTMVLGSTSIPTQTRTEQLAIDVGPDGGEVLLAYELELGSLHQRIRLRIRFAAASEQTTN
ncbi:MAG: hypothetical protein A2201_07645 [Alicyclobacillus sp. RIFOXYA1_FULL_53_8]|nr:MAG: hypothetical protein A2201_07645 [Alicyclobacillus sp. RIFOXYA1_FULL_53_8]